MLKDFFSYGLALLLFVMSTPAARAAKLEYLPFALVYEIPVLRTPSCTVFPEAFRDKPLCKNVGAPDQEVIAAAMAKLGPKAQPISWTLYSIDEKFVNLLVFANAQSADYSKGPSETRAMDFVNGLAQMPNGKIVAANAVDGTGRFDMGTINGVPYFSTVLTISFSDDPKASFANTGLNTVFMVLYSKHGLVAVMAGGDPKLKQQLVDIAKKTANSISVPSMQM